MKRNNHYLFFYSLAFWVGCIVLQPNIKLLFVGFFLWTIGLRVFTNNGKKILLLSYIQSFFVQVGMVFPFELIPPLQLSEVNNPLGFIIQFSLQPRNIVALLMLCSLIYDSFLGREGLRWKVPMLLIVFAYIAMLISAAIFSINSDISLLFFIQLLQTVLFFAFVQTVALSPSSFFQICTILAASLFFESFLALWQFLKRSGIGLTIENSLGTTLIEQNYEEALFRFRPFGTFSHANVLAGILILFIPLMIAFAIYSKKKWVIVTTVLASIVVTLSYSRSAWLSLTIVLIYFFFRFKNRFFFFDFKKLFKQRGFLMFLLTFACLSVFIILPRIFVSFDAFTQSGGAHFRLEQAHEALSVIERSPLFGVGLRMGPTYIFHNVPDTTILELPEETHNGYLQVAEENGLIVLFLLVGTLLYLLVQMFRSRPDRSHPNDFFVVAVGLGVVAGLINAFFQAYLIRSSEPFFDSYILLLFLGYTALHLDFKATKDA